MKTPTDRVIEYGGPGGGHRTPFTAASAWLAVASLGLLLWPVAALALRMRMSLAPAAISVLVGAPLAAVVGVVTGVAGYSKEPRGRRATVVAALVVNAAIVLLFAIVACASIWPLMSGEPREQFHGGP